ncbi:MAG TPA: DMT family transporter [Ramlibacter sp.]|nr:DMT family transporter [Ramlibacter sp.]
MNINHSRKAAVLGWGAAALMVFIGSGWQLATRAGARAELAPVDLALLRYTIPALVLAPVWWRLGLLPPQLGGRRLALIVGGAGLPFGLLAMAGASLAPAAHMGALLPGTSPMLVALLGWLWLGTRPRSTQVTGFVLLAIGIALITLPAWSAPQGQSWLGDLLFIAAATLWAIYTLALRDSGLGPWHSAALISAWSALGVIPLWLLAFAFERSLLPTAAASTVLTQALWQGLIAGIAGLGAFGVAVKYVGVGATTSVGALVPAIVAVGGWLLLNERLDALAWTGVFTVVLGVGLANRR